MLKKIVVASDSFKGSLSSIEVARAAEKAARRVFPAAGVVAVPVADGGEGTVEALSGLPGARMVECAAHDPLMRPVTARYAVLDGGRTAVIESAAACGLTLLSPEERDPLLTTTYGLGEIVRDAIERGCVRLIIGIGGSATNDGGTGMLSALGFRFTDNEGREVPGRGGDLSRITAVELPGSGGKYSRITAAELPGSGGEPSRITAVELPGSGGEHSRLTAAGGSGCGFERFGTSPAEGSGSNADLPEIITTGCTDSSVNPSCTFATKGRGTPANPSRTSSMEGLETSADPSRASSMEGVGIPEAVVECPASPADLPCTSSMEVVGIAAEMPRISSMEGTDCPAVLGRVTSEMITDKDGEGADTSTVDRSGAVRPSAEVRFEIACDVDNPFTGPRGAARVFAPQKGADPAAVERLEAGMQNLRGVVLRATGVDPDAVPGSGAAGGLGGAFHAFLGAGLSPGIDLILDAVGFDELLTGADLVITGEGSMDAQTLGGKTPYGVMKRARARGIPVVGICGSVREPERLAEADFTAVFPIVPGVVDLREAMDPANAARNVENTVENILRLVKTFHP